METITAQKPSECTEAELQDFLSLILAGGEVSAQGLEARIKKAEALIFLAHDNCLKGIAAVKNPEAIYKNDVFKKAHATAEACAFPFELGWVFVLPSSRGSGLSHKLVKAALSIACCQRIFATSRSDNAPMHNVLKTHGFSCHGEEYASTRGDHKLVLFVSNTAQQGASGDAPKAAHP